MSNDTLSTGFFRLARNESLKVKDFQFRVGAVLCRNAKPVSVGRNRPTKTSARFTRYGVFRTIHAEVDACMGIDRGHTIGATMYVYRESRNGTLAKSRPCSSCQGYLRDLGVREVFYTTKDGFERMRL